MSASWAEEVYFDRFQGDAHALTEDLRIACNGMRGVWDTKPGAAAIEIFARRMGDGAREKAVRVPLGESGVLEFFCSILTQILRGRREDHKELIRHCFRIIANSCADQDENRRRVVDSGCLQHVVDYLDDADMHYFTTTVLFNVSVDYKPAQHAIYLAGINKKLVTLLKDRNRMPDYNLIPCMAHLLESVASEKYDETLADPDTALHLFLLANDGREMDDSGRFELSDEGYHAVLETALAYLCEEAYQNKFFEDTACLGQAMLAFTRVCTAFDPSQKRNPEVQEQFSLIQDSFIRTLVELSGDPRFALLCPMDSHFITDLHLWIRTGFEANMPLRATTACPMLGNLARSEESCIVFVQKIAVHTKLIPLLRDEQKVDARLLHSVLGFLKNLALPQQNKAILGSAGLFDAGVLPRLWDLDTQPELQFAAVSLARSLVVGCPANVKMMCQPPMQTKGPSSVKPEGSERTNLQIFLDACARSDQQPTQMEAGRAAALVLRALHAAADVSDILSSPHEAQTMTALAAFYKTHGNIMDVIFRLGFQTKFPGLRSELLFALALIACSSEGAGAIARFMQRRPEAVAFLVDVVTGEKADTEDADTHPHTAIAELEEKMAALGNEQETGTEPGTEKTMTTDTAGGAADSSATVTPGNTSEADRSNALALVAGLLRHYPPSSPPSSSAHEKKETVEGEDEGEEGLSAELRDMLKKLLTENVNDSEIKA